MLGSIVSQKRHQYYFKKMGLSEFLSYIMAVNIGRKSSQLWVPVVVVIVVVTEAKPPSMSETIMKHIIQNHFSSDS